MKMTNKLMQKKKYDALLKTQGRNCPVKLNMCLITVVFVPLENDCVSMCVCACTGVA